MKSAPQPRIIVKAMLTTEERAEALCAQVDPEVFFPEQGGTTTDAKKVCARCPIRERCLEVAMINRERFGVFGGLSEPEREHLHKERARGTA
jgi:WhiB family redox-sensing transcriptional regulator